MVQFSPHNKHPVIVLRKEAWRIGLFYPSAVKDSWGIVVTLLGGRAGSVGTTKFLIAITRG